MDSHRIFLVTDVAPGGDNRCTVVVGFNNHRDALDALHVAHPQRVPVAAVSLAELEATVASVHSALRGHTTPVLEVLRPATFDLATTQTEP